MILDGKQLTEEIKRQLREKFLELPRTPKLAVVSVEGDAAAHSFVRIKKRFGEDIGVPVEVFEFHPDAGEVQVVEKIRELNEDETVGGIVVQLPLPKTFSKEDVLGVIAQEKDIDVLSEKAFRDFEFTALENLPFVLLPPVVGAVKKILHAADVDVRGQNALVIGKGQLVGRPAYVWLEALGANTQSAGKGEPLEAMLKEADIIISGAGSPGLIQPEMIKEGCVLIDAGTSEVSGELRGDADPSCAPMCSLFTPVPGGVGPVTVACLFENLLKMSLSDMQNSKW